MDPKLTTHRLPPVKKHGDMPRWEVKYDGQHIGWIQQEPIGRSSSVFYRALLSIQHQSLSLELSTDFEERCQTLLDAWRDPASSVHVRYWLGLPDPA